MPNVTSTPCKNNKYRKNNKAFRLKVLYLCNDKIHMMKKIILLYIICSFYSLIVQAADNQIIDSLKFRLDRTVEPQKRVDILINLYDLSESTEHELPYAYQLYNEAKNIKDQFALATPLGTITSHLLEANRTDSLDYYLDYAENLLKGSAYDGLTDYYRMTSKARILQTAKREEIAKLCDKYNKELEARKKKETPFQTAERLFLSGIITYQLMSLSEKSDWSKGLPYWEEAWALAQSFPLMTRKNFSANLCVCLLPSYAYIKSNQKMINVANTYLNNLDRYYEQEEIKKRRPFINKDIPYAICYQQLITSDNIIGKEKAHEYYLRYCDFIYQKKGDSLLRNKTFFYDISCRHYLNRKDYENALAYKDSLIQLMETGGALTTTKTGHYKSRAAILAQWGKYKEACEAYEKAIKAQDSLIEKEYVGKVSEMRVKHDVDKLELANTTLLAEKRKTALYFALCLILITISISIYLYLNLKKVTHLQKELIRESARAQESENMKTAFINSMCHEIRTPLNAICGFSELMSDESLSKEEKRDFPNIIQGNTKILTSLMNDILEVANLDSSSNIFPMEDTNVTTICNTEMERLEANEKKPNIEYKLIMPEENLIIKTNARYFALMIRSLLDNANKFTEKGSITLESHVNTEKHEAVFSVTDTGCGIPKEKYEYIFQRFSKLDEFTQGTGLGLYICKIIAQRMDGHIYIDPEYTQGTKFVITIPVA